MADALQQSIERRKGVCLRPIQKNATGGWEVGKTYYIRQWDQTCTVLKIQPGCSWAEYWVTCQWEDGTVTTHCTDLDPRWDYEVVRG